MAIPEFDLLQHHVFPQLPVRQWVLSLPKRLPYFLRHDRRTVTAVLTIFLRVVEQVLRERAPGAAPKARLGAVSFVRRFGSALNENVLCEASHKTLRLIRAIPALHPVGASLRLFKIAPGDFVAADPNRWMSVTASVAVCERFNPDSLARNVEIARLITRKTGESRWG